MNSAEDKENQSTKSSKRIKVAICGYDVSLLEEETKELVKLFTNHKVDYSGPTPFPNKRRLISLPISSHKHKDAQEQFERVIHRRVFFLSSTDAFKKIQSSLFDLLNSFSSSINTKISL